MINLSELGKYQAPKPSFPPVEYMTDEQLISEQGNIFLYDIECYPNYTLVAFKSYVTGRVMFFERYDDVDCDVHKLRWIVDNMVLVGFNNKIYDDVMVWAVIRGLWNHELKALSDSIIKGNMRAWMAEREFKFKMGFMNTIDVMPVAPSAAAFCSLKQYGARVHVQRLQDLPIDPDNDLTKHEQTIIRMYCVNDLDATGWLYHYLETPIQLRYDMGGQYELDLRSLSDAQIAEKVIGKEIVSETGIELRRPNIPAGMMFRFNNPEWMQFYTPQLQALHAQILNTDFVTDMHGKVLVYDKGVAKQATNLWVVKVGKSVYRLGVGGIHSSEKQQTYFTDDKHVLLDRDVASYYPAIILNQGLYPQHIGPIFLDIYRSIVDRRLAAKKAGDKSTANSLKICINGCFGKLGSKWSLFYAPDLLIQVTLTGQLALLMLIEMFEWCGLPVVSANTDGVVVRCPRDRENDYSDVVSQWERITGFETEETRYTSIHSRDVNNYIAVPEKGGFKAKGEYVNELSMSDKKREMLMKNPNGSICTEAVMLFLKSCRDPNPIMPADTIRNCKDIQKFIFVKRVKGGAVKDKTYIGKVVRWYMRFGEFGSIKYMEENKAGIKSTVAESTGSYPIMDITGFPKDIDYDWYIRRSYSMLNDLGLFKPEEKQQMLFDA